MIENKINEMMENQQNVGLYELNLYINQCEKAQNEENRNVGITQKKKKYERLKCVICFSAAAVISFSQVSPIWAADGTRVFDEAGLFSEQEVQELEAQIDAVRSSQNADLAVLTVEDAQGKSAEAYADDFYDSHELGVGDDASGILLSIDMDNREIYVSTSGYAARVLTDARVDDVLDAAYDGVADGNYADGALEAIEHIDHYLELGVPAGQYTQVRGEKKHSLEWYEVLFAAAAAAIVAALPCVSVMRRYKMQKEHRQALGYHMAYRADSTLQFVQNEEQFVNRSVVTRRIPRNPGPGAPGGLAGRTTMHQSSSGRMHGGGGRKF